MNKHLASGELPLDSKPEAASSMPEAPVDAIRQDNLVSATVGRTDPLLASDAEQELLPSIDRTTIQRHPGYVAIRQTCWPDDDQQIIIPDDLFDLFLDRLTDFAGIPSFGGPQR
jgi:hypothetical protein